MMRVDVGGQVRRQLLTRLGLRAECVTHVLHRASPEKVTRRASVADSYAYAYAHTHTLAYRRLSESQNWFRTNAPDDDDVGRWRRL